MNVNLIKPVRLLISNRHIRISDPRSETTNPVALAIASNIVPAYRPRIIAGTQLVLELRNITRQQLCSPHGHEPWCQQLPQAVIDWLREVNKKSSSKKFWLDLPEDLLHKWFDD